MLNKELLEKQRDIESRTNKNCLLKRVMEEFSKEDLGDIEPEIKKNIVYILAQVFLHKRLLPEALIALCSKRMELQDASDLIEELVENEWIGWNGIQLITALDLSDDVKKELDLYQFPLPMLIQPRRVNKNNDTGYWFCKKGSIILKDNYHEDDVCLDVINKANSIKLKLNSKTCTMVQNQWHDLDHQKKGETKEEYEQRLKQFNSFNERAKKVQDWLIQQGTFFITNKYDKRGRMYSQGYYVNPQGTDYQKACIELAKGEFLNS